MIKYKKVDHEKVKRELVQLPSLFASIEEIIAVYLFGSFRTGYIMPLSDVDIAILFKSGISKQRMEELELRIWEELTKRLKTEEIDLVSLNSAPLRIKYGVLGTSRLVYCADHKQRMDFEGWVIKRYLDFKPLREEYDREFLKGIGF